MAGHGPAPGELLATRNPLLLLMSLEDGMVDGGEKLDDIALERVAVPAGKVLAAVEGAMCSLADSASVAIVDHPRLQDRPHHLHQRVVHDPVPERRGGDAALAALQSGEVLAVLSERQPVLEVHFRQTGFVFSDRRYTYRPVVLVVPEGDSEFLDLVNLTLMSLEARGIHQELYELWFDDPTPGLGTWPGRPSISLTIQR